jgi:hypothetical protein
MLKQPGFVVVAMYTALVYAQFTMILMVRTILSFSGAKLLLTVEVAGGSFSVSLLCASATILEVLHHFVGIWGSPSDARSKGFSLQPCKALYPAD